MRSFAIEEPGSPVPALYATLVTTSTGITQEANANSAPLAPLPFDTLDWGEELLCKTYSMQRSVNDIFWAGIAQ